MYGIGISDRGTYLASKDNKPTKEYMLWASMLARCQPGGVQQNKHPTYIGCSVHPEFVHFQDFAEWCQNQIGFGLDDYALDKDLLIPGNKVYGPDTCVFIPQRLNKLLNANASKRGLYPIGVSYHAGTKRFRASIRIDGQKVELGGFGNADDAHQTYKIAKLNEIRRLADHYKDQIDNRVYNALISYDLNKKPIQS